MISEAEAVTAIGALAIGERDGTMEKAQITIGPFSGYVLVSTIQLAMRHPGLTGGGPTVGLLEQIRDQLLVLFPPGSAVREVLEMGMDPEHDMPTRVEELVATMGLEGGIMEIPVRDGAKNVDFACPICGGTQWRPMEDAYKCEQCRIIYGRETILGLIDAFLAVAAAHAESTQP